MQIDEHELVKRVKRTRDMAAFHYLVLAHQKRIYSVVRRIVQHHHDSEDLVQETFLRALKYINQLKDTGRFGSWVSRIAVNLALDYKQQRFGDKTVSIDGDLPLDSKELADEESQQRPISALQADEIRTHLDRALLKLPQKHRMAFVLFHQNGMCMKEIAEIMDRPETTVRTFVFRAVRNLRKQLKDFYILYKE